MKLCLTPTLLAVCAMLCAFSDLEAQTRFDFWPLGTRLSLDFRNEPPRALTVGPDTSLEAMASISDCKTGKLLFYSTGATVYNRNHVPMLNGQSLKSDISSTQGALIVPDPANDQKYYLFTTDQSGYVFDAQWKPAPHRGMFLHIVDMTGDNGLGEVIDRNLPLLPRCAEKLTGIWLRGSNTYWVVTHALDGDEYDSYKIDKDGVKGPYKSYAGVRFLNAIQYGPGALVASPDGTKLACLMSNMDMAELLRFDTLTGEVSLITSLPTVEGVYGAAFSPDNQKLYMQGIGLYQFDLRRPNITDLTKSRYTLRTTGSGPLQLGPDERIYVQGSNTHLGVIHNPNGLRALCNFDSFAIPVSYPLYTTPFGLPNTILGLYDEACGSPIARSLSPQEVCKGNCVSFTDLTPKATSWKWEFNGGTPSTSTKRSETVCYATPGQYKVQLIASNTEGSDTVASTVRVLPCQKPVAFLRDTSVCAGYCVTFEDTSSLSVSRSWMIEGGPGGATTGRTATICYPKLGKYKVTLIATNEYGSDTAYCYVTVIDCDDPVAAFEHDTLACVGEDVIYTEQTLNGASWDWRFSGGIPAASNKPIPGPVSYTAPGTYQIRLIVGNGSEYDTAYSSITVWECAPPKAAVANFTICEGECIELSDMSTSYPASWLWTLDGVTPSTYTTKDPGKICYSTPGYFAIELIVANKYGADTAQGVVTVSRSDGHASLAQLDILEDLTTCSLVDTFFWIYSECKPLSYQLMDVGSTDVTVTPPSADLQPYDSLLVRVRVKPTVRGKTDLALQIHLNDDVTFLPLKYNVLSTGGLTVSPLLVDFGETTICEERDTMLTVTNQSCDTVWLTAADIEPQFAVMLDFPIRLLPGESIDVPVISIADTAGKKQLLAGTLKLSSTPHILPPIDLSRRLRYPIHLRLEAVDAASGKQGDVVKFKMLLEGDVPASMSALHFDLLHNDDLLSYQSLSGAGLSLTNTLGSEDQRQSFTMSPVHSGVLGELSFKAYMAGAEQTTLSFDDITFEAAGISVAPECIAVISDSGSRFDYVYTCGDNFIHDRLNGTRLIKSLTPNPAKDEIRVELNVEGAFEVSLINALGSEVMKGEVDRIDVSALPSGVYYVRVAQHGQIQTARVIIAK